MFFALGNTLYQRIKTPGVNVTECLVWQLTIRLDPDTAAVQNIVRDRLRCWLAPRLLATTTEEVPGEVRMARHCPIKFATKRPSKKLIELIRSSSNRALACPADPSINNEFTRD